ncbi:MAG: STAS domain-containing protein [Solirubrobacterales bacterium]|nr:STAS domain-containing protein [Solirubrobacterales bacterium]
MRLSKFDVREEHAGSTLVVSVSGELDMNTVEVLSARVANQPQADFKAVTLDLREVLFMDSSGVKFLIEFSDRASQEGWSLRLVAPRHEAATLVLEATGADQALPFGPADAS